MAEGARSCQPHYPTGAELNRRRSAWGSAPWDSNPEPMDEGYVSGCDSSVRSGSPCGPGVRPLGSNPEPMDEELRGGCDSSVTIWESVRLGVRPLGFEPRTNG